MVEYLPSVYVKPRVNLQYPKQASKQTKNPTNFLDIFGQMVIWSSLAWWSMFCLLELGM